MILALHDFLQVGQLRVRNQERLLGLTFIQALLFCCPPPFNDVRNAVRPILSKRFGHGPMHVLTKLEFDPHKLVVEPFVFREIDFVVEYETRRLCRFIECFFGEFCQSRIEPSLHVEF